MKRLGWIAAIVAGAVATPAAGQYVSEAEAFVQAVRDRDGPKATEILNARGESILNRRNAKGETALLVAIGERDDGWTLFLLQKGADPNYPADDGTTPLIAAARIGFVDAVDWLLTKGADVNGTNRMGETALIAAVQQRHEPVVELLLEKGADPDKADAAAGYSARDYAKRDTRARGILELIEQSRPKAVTMDQFKLK